MKSTIEIKKGTLIKCKGFDISIGTHDTSDIAIISHSSGDFAKFADIRKGGRLAKIKRKFKLWLCSQDDFCFSFMPNDITLQLIQMLK
jgi:hypothetical protein